MKIKMTTMPSPTHAKSSSAILLVHFGCPTSPGPLDTYRFLIEIFDRLHGSKAGLFQQILSRTILAPLALKTSLKRYRSIHTKEGFPLMQHCKKLVSSLNAKLGSDSVFLSMQHGDPSIEDVCKEIKKRGFQKIIIMPLYPQRVPDMTQSIYIRAHHALKKLKPPIEEIFIEDFPLENWYINPFAQLVQKEALKYENILFSYHSVPKKGSLIYQQQCQETSKEIMKRSGAAIPWSIGFQSKMRSGKWLQDESCNAVINLAQKGVKTLLVLAPSFITPCSETILDIERELRELFLQNGGEKLDLLPPLCCQENFITGLSEYLSIFL